MGDMSLIAGGALSSVKKAEIMKSAGAVWREVRTHLRKEYGDTVFSSNIARLRVREEADQSLLVIAPSRFYRDWVEDHVGARLRALWAQHDPEGRALRLLAEEDVVSVDPAKIIPVSTATSAEPAEADQKRAVGERFTFDTFMVGPSNEMASAAARAIVNASPSPFNPAFFYGEYGVGKTHLLNAIAHSVELGGARRKALYLTAEEFLSGFVSAMRKKDTITFKESVRRVDVLLIDDVHFIAGKPKTEDEFLHTVASLIADEKQVVLASHRPPAELNVSDQRLASLLKGGFACELRKPDLDLRRKILDCKIAQAGSHYPELDVPETVRDFLAARMTASARELEGVLNNVIGRTALLGRPVTMEAVESALRELSIVSERRVTVDVIQKAVAERFGVQVADILSKRRTKTVVKPRHVAMYLAKTMTTRSLPDIGRRFGNRDHSTVIHAVNKISELIDAGDPVKDEIESLSEEIRG
jgi:chromosomal replication initiator protein